MDPPTFDVAAATDVSVIIRNWEESQQTSTFDPVPYLGRLAELVEAESEVYMKMDPDPFDDRHPSRSDPSSNLGHMLKMIFKREIFMNKLIGDYTRESYWTRLGQPNRDVNVLNIAAARLLLDVVPGLETSVVFQETDGLITRLFSWAEKAPNPLQTYATGLLSAAMEVSEIAGNHKESNLHLVPIMLERLRDILNAFYEEKRKEKRSQLRPFEHLQTKSPSKVNGIEPIPEDSSPSSKESTSLEEVKVAEVAVADHEFAPPKKRVKRRKSRKEEKLKLYHTRETATIKFENALGPKEESSNSSWAELEVNLIGTMHIYPPSEPTKMIMILRYLASLGEYQDLLAQCIEHNALDLILRSTDLRTTGDSRLAFEALKYLSALLCHKKFALDFLSCGGLQKLLSIPRPSIAATGVSMCLYYLACSEDAMERVCSGDQRVVETMVTFTLWLLECGHESGRWNATMFFAATYKFTKILELFDQKDGLRLLFNVISTLSILNEDENLLDEDREYIEKQSVRHVCAALKKYFEAHMSNKLFTLVGNEGSPGPSYRNQVLKESIYDHIQMMLEFLPYKARWTPVERFMLLGGVHQMLSIIGMAYDWTYSGRAETVRSALEVLALVTVYPKAQLALCEKISLPDENSAVGMHIILGASEGEIVNDSEVQKAALSVIINCVCASVHRVGDDTNFLTPNVKRKGPCRSPEELLEKMWDCVRSNNGIMVLLQLLLTKSPITDADSIRALACQALCGLARSAKVIQILSQLPLFVSGQLQVLIREPILQDKRQEHVKFQKFALELLEKVSGKAKPALNEFEYSLDRIRKADIVAQTRITYNEKQLLTLIQQYLLSRGYQHAAEALQRDADLPAVMHRGASAGFPPRPPTLSSPASALRQVRPFIATTPVQALTPRQSMSIQGTPAWAPLTASPRNSAVKRIIKTPKSIQKATEMTPSSASKSLPDRPPGELNRTANLEDIVKEYLMNQHALCKNPMVTCPEFDLFLPHKCPDPKPRGSAPTNFTMRYVRRGTLPPFGGPMGGMMDRHLVYSRYRPQRTIRPVDNESAFTCATFSACEQFVMVGTNGGELKLFNKLTGVDEATYTCHDSAIFKIEPNRDGSLVLTSSSWRRPLSAVWSMGEFFDLKYSFDDEESVEFSKLIQDRIVGTRNEVATIYDVNTGQSVMTLRPTSSNAYTRNQATFNYTDELILSDGVLWDVTSGKEIHKFDKLNQQLSGSFHPNGLEIVSNAEVWDLRTFHLLRTVPVLSQCHPVFANSGRVMFGVPLEKEHDDQDNQHFETSFKVLDALTYSQISTIDVKRSIYSLAIDTDDLTLALVENTGRDDVYNDLSESVVKLYDVGKQRDEDQAPEQGDEEADEDDEDDDDGPSTGSDTAEFLDDFGMDGDQMSDWARSGSSVSSFTNSHSGGSSWITESSDDDRRSNDDDQDDDDILSALNS